MALSYILFIAIFGSRLISGHIITTSDGQLNGTIIKDAISEYYAYRCIPYAQPPVADLRFRPPVPVNNWQGVRQDTNNCPVCPQFAFGTNTNPMGQEDCLYLNVYVPKHFHRGNCNRLLPTMLFIHGGDWRSGTGNFGRYDPSFFMREENVVLVTFNYRLGPLGFMSAGDECLPGNDGLRDQNLVLKWVQKNIEKFGGNPRKVTLFGPSSGASSVRFHALSPKSKGLFAGGIAQSGTELCTWAWQSTSDSVKLFKEFSNYLNCTSRDNEEVVECLRKKSSTELLLAEVTVFKDEFAKRPYVLFKPVTEVPNKDGFLCKNPYDMLKNGEGYDVPMIISTVKNEGGIVLADHIARNNTRNFEQHPEWTLPISSASFRMGCGVKKQITKEVRKCYFSNVNNNTSKLYSAISDLISDGWITQCVDDFITLNRKCMKAPIYQYLLSYRGKNSFCNLVTNQLPKEVCHFDEELYLFDLSKVFGMELNSEDRILAKKLVELYTNFAEYQNPTPSGKSCLKWLPISTSAYEYLNIVSPNKMVMDGYMNRNRVEFWRDLAYRYDTTRPCCEDNYSSFCRRCG